MTPGAARPSIRTVSPAEVPVLPLGGVGTQQVLLGQPHGDGSPLLLGITSLRPNEVSPLIQHDAAEVAYVIAGRGSMVTDDSEHPFEPGDAILIDARCWHAIRAGDEPVTMLYVFPCPGVPPTRVHASARA